MRARAKQGCYPTPNPDRATLDRNRTNSSMNPEVLTETKRFRESEPFGDSFSLKKNRPRNGIRKPPNDESSVNKSSRPSLVSLVQNRFARRRFDSGRHHPPLPHPPSNPIPHLSSVASRPFRRRVPPRRRPSPSPSPRFTPVAGVVAFAAARSNKDFMGDAAGATARRSPRHHARRSPPHRARCSPRHHARRSPRHPAPHPAPPPRRHLEERPRDARRSLSPRAPPSPPSPPPSPPWRRPWRVSSPPRLCVAPPSPPPSPPSSPRAAFSSSVSSSAGRIASACSAVSPPRRAPRV